MQKREGRVAEESEKMVLILLKCEMVRDDQSSFVLTPRHTSGKKVCAGSGYCG